MSLVFHPFAIHHPARYGDRPGVTLETDWARGITATSGGYVVTGWSESFTGAYLQPIAWTVELDQNGQIEGPCNTELSHPTNLVIEDASPTVEDRVPVTNLTSAQATSISSTIVDSALQCRPTSCAE